MALKVGMHVVHARYSPLTSLAGRLFRDFPHSDTATLVGFFLRPTTRTIRTKFRQIIIRIHVLLRDFTVVRENCEMRNLAFNKDVIL